MTDLKNNLEEVCSCSYLTKDGKTVHSVTCKKSSFFNHEIRFGFAEVGLEEIKKDILKLEQELQKTREQLSKAEQRIFHAPHCVTNYERNDCDCGYEQYFKDKQGE